MKQIPNKEYERYRQYLTDCLHGCVLTPDGLRMVCGSFDNNPEEIGKHMLLMVEKYRSEGLYDCRCEEE